MSAIGTILRELAGLFVDDGALALGAVIWLGVCALLFRGTGWGGVALFVGLALLLAGTALRAARRGKSG